MADAVNPPEALLQPVRVPGQVVVDHQMGALQVDALTRRVSGEQHLHLAVVQEHLLRLTAVLPAYPAVNDDDGTGPADRARDAFLEVVLSKN